MAIKLNYQRIEDNGVFFVILEATRSCIQGAEVSDREGH